MARRILIIDDEQGIRAALGQLLEFEGYEVRAVGNAVDGIAEYEQCSVPHLVFLDVKMAGIDGLETLKKHQGSAIRARCRDDQRPRHDPDRRRGHAARRVRHSREAARHRPHPRHAAQRARGTSTCTRRTRGSRETIESRYEIVGKSYGIRALIDKIERVGPTPARVLITGENGTGKELVARALHSQSPRADGAVRRGELRGDSRAS